VRETTALIPTVVPCESRFVCASRSVSGIPMCSAAAATELMKPVANSGGVEGDLPIVTAPSGATTVQSVKVPPMSTLIL
jgi:hypothetical protein